MTLPSVPDPDLTRAQQKLEGAPPEDVLAWVERTFGPTAAIASSFGAEDVVLLDMASRAGLTAPIFTLDTGRLHPETYELMEIFRRRYGRAFEVYFPDRAAVEALVSEEGLFSFRESVDARKRCCALRKVQPLRRALEGRAAWITGLRREQSVTRVDVQVVERDATHGLIKVNPLAAWSEREIWAYVRDHQLPYNALHDRGFPSIGCAPCTRAIKPYEDARAGRWWWESPEHKECGLHAAPFNADAARSA